MKRRVLSVILVLTMVFSMVPFAALAEAYPSITQDEAFSVELDVGSSVWYQFVPEKTKKYTITSFDEINVDPFCKVYDSGMNLIEDGDDNNGANFEVNVELTAGETYYFEFSDYEKDNSGSYSVKLTKQMPTDFWLDRYSFESYVGSYFNLVANVYPYDDDAKIIWESSDSSVATVDEDGLVRLVGEGTAIITAIAENGLEDNCLVSSGSSTPIYLNDVKTVPYIPKENREAAAVFRFVPETSGTYRMYSYDIISETEDIAVDPRIWAYDIEKNQIGYDDDSGEDVNVDLQCRLEAGQIYFFMLEPYDCAAAGQITVTLVSCVSAESVSIDSDDLIVEEGGCYDIFVTMSPKDCAMEDYVCTSSDSSVVRIQDKTAYFVGGGEATITVTSESGLTDSINVTVLPLSTVSLDTTTTLACSGSMGYADKRYKFIPEESGVYRFESSNIIGNLNPRISLSDMENALRYNLDVIPNENLNFRLDHELLAGKTYFIDVRADITEGEEDGSVDFKITKLDDSKIPVFEPNSSVELIFDVPGSGQYFIFKPTVNGIYKIFSSKEEDNGNDPKVFIFNSNWELYGSNDDGLENSNFCYEEELCGGETYYIKAIIYNPEETGGYMIHNVCPCGITFDANGGTGTIESVVVDPGTEYTLPENGFTAPEGMQFKAWSVDGVEKAAGDVIKITADTTVIAVWEEIPVVTHTVFFDANGGEGSMEDATVASGSEYMLPENSFTAPEGMQFKAWSVDGVEKAVGDVIEITADTTVIAVWEDIPVITYTVSFDANGGEGSIEDATVASGSEYTLPENGFTAPEGMQFKAWSVDGIEKAVGDVIEITADTTVIAVWEDIPVENPGDINDDGSVDMFDYLMVKSIYFKKYTPSDDELARADINEDGSVDMFDYLEIKQICFA